MNLKTIIGTFVVGMLLVSCAHSDNRLTVNVSQEVFRKILHSKVASAPKDGLQLVLHPQGCNCLPL